MYAREAWQEERASWKAIVQLNLVRNVTTILHTLSRELSRPSSPTPGPDEEDDEDGPPLAFTEKHQLLKLRLAPLRNLQVRRAFRGPPTPRAPPARRCSFSLAPITPRLLVPPC